MTCQELYTGADHRQMPLRDKYFQYVPNPYYHDVEIMSERFMMLSQQREEMPGLKIIERPNVYQNNSESLNPEKIPLDLTCSGLLRPLEPTNTEKSVKDLLIWLLGNEKVANEALQGKKIAQGDWDWINAEPVKELNTPGFFALAFPTIFISGSCDFTTPKVSKSDFKSWIEHIYFNKDNRVSSHPYLKRFLLNLQNAPLIRVALLLVNN